MVERCHDGGRVLRTLDVEEDIAKIAWNGQFQNESERGEEQVPRPVKVQELSRKASGSQITLLGRDGSVSL